MGVWESSSPIHPYPHTPILHRIHTEQTMTKETRLTRLEPGMQILVGGDRIVHVSAELAEKFLPGDRLIAVRKTDCLLYTSPSPRDRS